MLLDSDEKDERDELLIDGITLDDDEMLDKLDESAELVALLDALDEPMLLLYALDAAEELLDSED